MTWVQCKECEWEGDFNFGGMDCDGPDMCPGCRSVDCLEEPSSEEDDSIVEIWYYPEIMIDDDYNAGEFTLDAGRWYCLHSIYMDAFGIGYRRASKSGAKTTADEYAQTIMESDPLTKVEIRIIKQTREIC